MEKDSNQCANCGGIRVAGSTLCADCIVALCNRQIRSVVDLMNEKEALEEKNRKLHELCNRLLDHITEDMIYSNNLWSQAGKGKYYSKKGD